MIRRGVDAYYSEVAIPVGCLLSHAILTAWILDYSNKYPSDDPSMWQ